MLIMKRTTACLLALLLACALMLPAAAAQDKPCSCGHSPVIVLPGYSGSYLYLNPGQADEQQVWPLTIDGTTLRSLGEVLGYILPKLLADPNENADKVIEKFGDLFALTDALAMNPDGTSKHNVDTLPNNAYNFRWDVMLARGQERLNNQRPITNSLLEGTTADHIYVYSNDWRRGQVDGSARLHEFIQMVKEDSGHDQVSFFAISYGGQLAASYFAFYGGADVDRAVLHSPAIRGSSLAVDLLENESFAFDPVSLMEILTVYLGLESALAQRLTGLNVEKVSDFAVALIRKYLKPLAVNFGSFWDLIPLKDYERLKAQHLDPAVHARIIQTSGQVHNMMEDAGEILRRVQAEGTKIAIIAGTGLPLASGSTIDSDYIIDTAYTTGAAALPLDSGGRSTAALTVCSDPAHTHTSPDRRMDAASAYLPEQTWFFKGQYHGQAATDSYARGLYLKWLFSDDLTDVYSDPQYPQYRDSCNPFDALEARFSGSVSGYLTAGDNTLLLKNLSDYELSLLSVTAEGLPFDLSIISSITLRPGETLRLRYTTALPAQQQQFTLQVRYVRESPVPSKETRSFAFTALPAEAPIPLALRYEDSSLINAGLHLRPARMLLIALALFLSLCLAAFAVWQMYRGRLLPAEREKRSRRRRKNMN